jgi:flagellar basal body-associated protein FliL
MTPKRLIFIALISVFCIFLLTLGAILIWRLKTTPPLVASPPKFIYHDYTYHKKTFPAPYKEVGNLPKQ